MKIKSKEFIIDLTKESERNRDNKFIRIFPTELMHKYEPFIENSINFQIYRQVNSVLFSNRIINHNSIKNL